MIAVIVLAVIVVALIGILAYVVKKTNGSDTNNPN